MIELSVNGEMKTLPQAVNLDQALEAWAFGTEQVVVAVNQVFVPRTEWTNTVLTPGDQVDVLQAVVGG